MSVLILGQTGQVARALQQALPDAVALGRAEADLEQPQQLRTVIAAQRPNVIINAAAYTAVDAAEDDRARAFAVNAAALDVIGVAAREIGALVVHYSTDYVFDGAGETPFSEASTPHPLGVYGESKLAGEAALQASGADHLILRVSWVYAPEGKNFPLTMLRLARERDNLSVVDDQIGAPTAARRIAAATSMIIARVAADRSLGGLYHLAPSGFVSWHGFAQALIGAARAQGAVLKADAAAVKSIPSSAYPTRAARPRNSRLDTSKLRSTFNVDLPDWRDDMAEFIATLRKEERL